MLVMKTRRSTLERKSKKHASGKAKVRIKDFEIKDAGKLKGGVGSATQTIGMQGVERCASADDHGRAQQSPSLSRS